MLHNLFTREGVWITTSVKNVECLFHDEYCGGAFAFIFELFGHDCLVFVFIVII